MKVARTNERYDRWVAALERPLLMAALAFLAALCVPVLLPDLGATASSAVSSLNAVIWLLFALDYLVRLSLTADRRAFVLRHPLDLIVVLVPFFRPLRLLRLVSLTKLMTRKRGGGLVKDVTLYVCVAAALVMFFGAVGTLDAERYAPQSRITTFLDALWFSCSTMTAVPYGDVYPVTQQGRLVAAVLMVLGLVLVGILTAAIAAWLVDFVSGDAEIEADLGHLVDSAAAEQRDLHEVQARLAAIEALLRERSGPLETRTPTPAR